MALFSFVSDLLFGKPEVPKADFDEMAKLLKLGIEENRYSQYGPFSNLVWDAGKDSLTREIDPAIQPGVDALKDRVAQGSPGYGGAGRFENLLNAYMEREPTERRPVPERRGRPTIERQVIYDRPELNRPDPYGAGILLRKVLNARERPEVGNKPSMGARPRGYI